MDLGDGTSKEKTVDSTRPVVDAHIASGVLAPWMTRTSADGHYGVPDPWMTRASAHGHCGVPWMTRTSADGHCGVPDPWMTRASADGYCGVPWMTRTSADGHCGVPDPWMTRASAPGHYNGPLVMYPGFSGSFCGVPSFMAYPLPTHGGPWAHTWVPWGASLGTGYPYPGPSVWPWGAPGLDPWLGSRAPVPAPSWEYPQAPPPYCLAPPTRARACTWGPPPGFENPATWPPSAVGIRGHIRGAAHPQSRREVSPPWASGLHSTWPPQSPPSPDLCPLPPSPVEDPQPRPQDPLDPHRPPCKARRRLFGAVEWNPMNSRLCLKFGV